MPRLRFLYGFDAPVSLALGYGKSLHDALAEIHSKAISGEVFGPGEAPCLVRDHLFLAFANDEVKARSEEAAAEALARYLREDQATLSRLEHVEKPIELKLVDGTVVTGRIDLIRRTDTQEVAIVDFKSDQDAQSVDITMRQLHVYALGYNQLTGQNANLVEIKNLDRGATKREVIDAKLIQGTVELVSKAGRDLARAALSASSAGVAHARTAIWRHLPGCGGRAQLQGVGTRHSAPSTPTLLQCFGWKRPWRVVTGHPSRRGGCKLTLAMSAEGLFTNRSGEYVANAFTGVRDCDVQIASAFFSDAEMVHELVDRRCRVDLIVRLGPGTSAEALASCVGLAGVNVRYYPDSSFHPKAYIFGDSHALVGSANLTASGLGKPNGHLNQEAAVVVEGGDPRFDDLREYFAELWQGAGPFDRDAAEKYRRVAARFPSTEAAENLLAREFGDFRFNNLGRPDAAKARQELYANAFRKRLQKALSAIAVVTDVYAGLGRRKESRLPLSIEVDQLFNYIRHYHATGETYLTAPRLGGEAQLARIRAVAEEYLRTDWPYLAQIAEDRYPRIRQVLGSRDAIADASDDQLWSGLTVVHALEERLRFFRGGLPTLRVAIFANGSEKIQATLTHLIHGAPPAIERIVDCLFGRYRLPNFGESFLQETLGWVKPEQFPICNGRTLIALYWLGFDVAAEGVGTAEGNDRPAAAG